MSIGSGVRRRTTTALSLAAAIAIGVSLIPTATASARTPEALETAASLPVAARPIAAPAGDVIARCAPGDERCRTANWMSRIYSRAPRTTLSQMVIPGTHDSGAHGIRGAAPCSTAYAYGAPDVLDILSEMQPCAIADLLKAQGLTIRQQLERGVRYLDLRVGVPRDAVPATAPAEMAADPSTVPLVLYHQLVAQPLTDALDDIQGFIARHPREQVILDFQDVALPSDPGLNAYYRNALHRLLQRYAPPGASSICRTAWTREAIPVRDERIGGVPIRRAWKAGVSAIVYFLPDEMPAQDDCYRARWAGGGFLWPNTDSVEQSRADNLGYLEERRDRIASGECIDASGNQWCGIFVSQLQLTPALLTYAVCANTPSDSCSLRHLATVSNAGLADLIRRWRFGRGLPVNIAMVDWIEAGSPALAEGLIATNRRIARTAG